MLNLAFEAEFAGHGSGNTGMIRLGGPRRDYRIGALLHDIAEVIFKLTNFDASESKTGEFVPLYVKIRST